jgi:HNH endonuclease
MSRPARPLLERFEEKYIPEPNSGCWIWVGALDRDGYGRFYVDGTATSVSAHRISYALFKDILASDLQLDHLCRNRLCINPDHLEQVTARENWNRGFTLARRTQINNQCQRGHELTPDNVKISADKRRRCRQCTRLSQQRYDKRRQKCSDLTPSLG